MKKATVILLICIYSLATMGFALKEFYCCGQLKSINLPFTPDTKQDCSKGEGAGCCDNKYKFFKVKDKHISSEKAKYPVNYYTDLLLLYSRSLYITIFPAHKSTIAYSSHAPPVDEEISIYLLNCVFKI